jgi:hypothetical protein
MSLVTDKVKLFKGVFMVEIPDGYRAAVMNLLEKKNGYVHLMLGTPQKSKSIGHRSEVNLIHGSCESIAEQLGYYENMTKAQAMEYVKGAMKRLAVGAHGYPTIMNDIDGHEEPMSLTYASSEQAQMVINTVLDYCSMNDLWLVRYTEDYPPKPEKYLVSTGKRIE